MMKDIWFISDTHFFHENILKFKDSNGDLIRGNMFTNMKEMNEYMLDMWNSHIKQGDRVYHLGDVVCGKYDQRSFKTFWSKLNGSKHLLVGNHDDVKFLSCGGFFKKVSLWRMFPDYGFIASHVPLHESQMMRYGGDGPTILYNIHGHIHQNDSPTKRHINVSVEKTDYKPVHLDTILAMISAIRND